MIGTGDGLATVFQLAKTYSDAGGSARREIAKPVAGTVRLGLNGVELANSAFLVEAATGRVTLAVPPATGQMLTAGFEFDVPVRFDTDRLDINLAAFRAGAAPSVPLIEIRP